MKQKLFASVPRYLVLCGCSFVVVFTAIAVLQAVLEVFAWSAVALVIWISLMQRSNPSPDFWMQNSPPTAMVTQSEIGVPQLPRSAPKVSSICL